ncbi:MAG: hypothetical protein AABX33_05695 [Nanoarchaeota archaeon]
MEKTLVSLLEELRGQTYASPSDRIADFEEALQKWNPADDLTTKLIRHQGLGPLYSRVKDYLKDGILVPHFLGTEQQQEIMDIERVVGDLQADNYHNLLINPIGFSFASGLLFSAGYLLCDYFIAQGAWSPQLDLQSFASLGILSGMLLGAVGSYTRSELLIKSQEKVDFVISQLNDFRS